MIVALNIFFLVLLSFLLFRSIGKGELSSWFITGLIFKILAGLAVGILYFYIYEYGDTILYYTDASSLAEIAYHAPLEYFNILVGNADLTLHYSNNPRALFFVKLISPVLIISGKNYWICSLYLSIISFTASWYLLVTIVKHFPAIKYQAIFSLLFFPSVVFWSSGILKESIAFSIIAVLIMYFIQLIYSPKLLNVWKLVVAAILLYVLFMLKYYYAAAILVAIVPTIMITSISWKTKVKHPVITWIALCVFVGFVVSTLHPNLNFNRIIEVLVENNQLYEQHYDLAKTIHYYKLESEWWSILINTPLALISIWFRPFVFEAGSFLQIALGIENLMILTLFIGLMIRKPTIKSISINLLLSALTYILVLSIFLAISSPNFGTLSRYRVSFLPFLIMLISSDNYFWDIAGSKLVKIIPRKR